MKTKYDTNDEVLIPVKIKYAMKLMGEIYYAMQNLTDADGDILFPEGVIKRKSSPGVEKHQKKRQKQKR